MKPRRPDKRVLYIRVDKSLGSYIDTCADREQRSVQNMCAILLQEAVGYRKAVGSQVGAKNAASASPVA